MVRLLQHLKNSLRTVFRPVFLVAFFILLVVIVLVSYQQWRSLAANTPEQGTVFDLAAGEELHFLILGDQGSGSPEQQKVATAMEDLCRRSKIDGVLLLGDNFYPEGVVSRHDPQWSNKFEQMYLGNCLKSVKFYATLGNHDYKGNALAQIEYGAYSKNWFLPGRFYGLQLGDLVEIVNVDTTMLDLCFNDKKCSLNFLASRLSAKKTSRWRIVMGHHPMRSSSTKGFTYNGRDPRAMIMRKVICGRADLALFGHSHHLELRHDADCATPFAIMGAGGASLVQVKSQGNPLFLKSTHGFGHLHISRQQMKLSLYNELGEELFTKLF